jgi:DNA-binding CsgD family transcriptional regulator
MMNKHLLDRVKLMRDQEKRVLSLLTFGYPNKLISSVLGVSEATVKYYVSSILIALQCSNRTQAALVGLCLLNKMGVEDIVGRRRAGAAMHLHMNRFEKSAPIGAPSLRYDKEASASGR